ncbi:Uncharacterized protein APZ42_006386 [Daphnia magna]|uniref:Uncharacterized protein n=1 Tax=Daphnia magna TaxID=35525 RepID=A0A164FXH2_9CRUS|nr:Uncharacterized protein APZ42_006386 [Daphnia magna]
MKIGALPEIFIGDIALGALGEEMMEEAPKLVVQKGCWVPPRSMKVVATQPLDMKGFGESALVEPSQALQRKKRVSTGKVLVSGMGTIGQMAIGQIIGPPTMDRRGDGVRNNRASDRNQGGRHASSRRDSRGREKKRFGSTNLKAGLEKG